MSSTLPSLESKGDSSAFARVKSRLTKTPRALDADSANDCCNDALDEPLIQNIESKLDVSCRANSAPEHVSRSLQNMLNDQ